MTVYARKRVYLADDRNYIHSLYKGTPNLVHFTSIQISSFKTIHLKYEQLVARNADMRAMEQGSQIAEMKQINVRCYFVYCENTKPGELQ